MRLTVELRFLVLLSCSLVVVGMPRLSFGGNGVGCLVAQRVPVFFVTDHRDIRKQRAGGPLRGSSLHELTQLLAGRILD